LPIAASGSVTKWLSRNTQPCVHRLEFPPHVRSGVGVGVLEKRRRLDTQDRARHRHRFVTTSDKHHLTALSEVDCDVGVERQPPVRQPRWIRDRAPHVADRVREVAFDRMTPPSAVRSSTPS
jgi:hypothetical protein